MLKLLYPHYWIYYDMAEEEGGSDTDMGDTDTGGEISDLYTGEIDSELAEQGLVRNEDGTISVIDDGTKKIRSLIIKKEEEPINPRGETRNITIYGDSGATFTLTIKDSSGCSILKEELEWVKIPNSGSYSINQKFPILDSGKTSENYNITIKPGADTSLVGFLWDVEPNVTMYQYADQTVTLAYTSSTAHDPIGASSLTLSGGGITKKGPAKRFSDTMGGYSTTTSTVNLTSGSANAIYAKDNIPSFNECVTSSTAIKKIVVNDSDKYEETNIIKLAPAPQASTGSAVTNTYIGDIKVGMTYRGKVSHEKTVERSIDEDGVLITDSSCSELTDRFRLSNNHKLFEGMGVFKNGQYISEIKSIGMGDKCDPLKDITLISKHIIKDGTVLTFKRNVGGIVEKVSNNETTNRSRPIQDGGASTPCENSIIILGSEYIPDNTELTFDDNDTIVDGRITTKNSGFAGNTPTSTAGTMSVTVELDVFKFGTKDVTYTVDLDKIVTKRPTAHDQEVTTNKNTAVTIYPKLYDTDVNAYTKTVTVFTNPKHGTVSSYDSDYGTIVYTPYTNFVGEDKFGFRTNDGTNPSDEKTIYITVKR